MSPTRQTTIRGIRVAEYLKDDVLSVFIDNHATNTLYDTAVALLRNGLAVPLANGGEVKAEA